MNTTQRYLGAACLVFALCTLPVMGADRIVVVEEFTRIG
jgi:hypothetical protein